MKNTNVIISANWEGFEKRLVWCTITSRELSKILNVSLQTINNWKMREILPLPEEGNSYKGNVNRYKISKIRAWLEGKNEDEIIWSWIREHMDCGTPFKSIDQAQEVARIGWDALGLERPLV